jgi:hypothetical protein
VPTLLTLATVEAKSNSRVWAVRKMRGTPKQRVGWKAHDRGMLCSCAPEVYQPPIHGFSLCISSSYSYRNNSQPVNALRMRVERTFAWEDKFKRLRIRFERIQQRHYGMKLMAYTLINLRAFCGI